MPAREGRVISTGINDAGGELVFYGVRIHAQQLPGITFGIMAGLRDSAGRLTPEVETNETQGSASSAGFHAVEAASSVGSPAVAVPEFGYYAGPAATITAQQGGRQVQAHLARWSADPRIVIFWFARQRRQRPGEPRRLQRRRPAAPGRPCHPRPRLTSGRPRGRLRPPVK